MDPSAVANGFLSVRGLHQLLDSGVTVRHVNRLHAGKYFVVGSRAMLGSANLTGAGLGTVANQNRELGIEVAADRVEQVRETINSWPSHTIDRSNCEFLEASRGLTKQAVSMPDDELDSLSALHLAEKLLTDARDPPTRSLWLKLEYGEPALDGMRDRIPRSRAQRRESLGSGQETSSSSARKTRTTATPSWR